MEGFVELWNLVLGNDLLARVDDKMVQGLYYVFGQTKRILQHLCGFSVSVCPRVANACNELLTRVVDEMGQRLYHDYVLSYAKRIINHS